jgi:hypothetical protein
MKVKIIALVGPKNPPHEYSNPINLGCIFDVREFDTDHYIKNDGWDRTLVLKADCEVIGNCPECHQPKQNCQCNNPSK